MSAKAKEPGPVMVAGQDLPVPPVAIPECNVRECFANVDGARMRYLRAGTGPPLVLLHGLLGYSFSWRFTIPALTPHFTVFAPDMLGVGFSDRPSNLDCSLRANAERILRFLDIVDISSFDMLGTSHGGAVAIKVAASVAKSRLKRLVLVAPVNPWSAHGRHLAPFLGSTIGSALFRGTVARTPSTWDFWLRRLYGDPRRITPGTLEGYAAPYKIPGTFQYGLGVVRHWMRDLQEIEFLLPKIANTPTLLIWGSRDRAVNPGSADKLRAKLHHCESVVLDGAGHLPYEESPDEFNAVLLRFLLAQHNER